MHYWSSIESKFSVIVYWGKVSSDSDKVTYQHSNKNKKTYIKRAWIYTYLLTIIIALPTMIVVKSFWRHRRGMLVEGRG